MLLGVFALVAGACTSDGDVAQKDFDAVSVELAAVQAELAARVAEVDTGTATIAARDAEIENAAVYLAAAGVEIEGGVVLRCDGRKLRTEGPDQQHHEDLRCDDGGDVTQRRSGAGQIAAG